MTEVLIVLLAALLLLAALAFLRVFQVQVVLARNAQALPLMPNSGRCILGRLCIGFYATSSRVGRQVVLVTKSEARRTMIRLTHAPLRSVDKSTLQFWFANEADAPPSQLNCGDRRFSENGPTAL